MVQVIRIANHVMSDLYLFSVILHFVKNFCNTKSIQLDDTNYQMIISSSSSWLAMSTDSVWKTSGINPFAYGSYGSKSKSILPTVELMLLP